MTTLADPFDVARALTAPGILREFNDAGVLSAADVHVARRLADLGGEEDESVWLAAALAVRGPRLGHVYVDLAAIQATATVDADELVDVAALPWPVPGSWPQAVAASGLVALGEEDDRRDNRPLRLVGTALYLDRYWREERQLAADLRALSDDPPQSVRLDPLAEGLERLFAGATDEHQRLAAAAAVLSRFAVVAGGPGTGKTTTVARIVALLAEQAAAAGSAERPETLAAPT
ncbi:MAG: AAA family ATPase, partial [Thermoleophilaceae bacterium]|nr:AAA family ATPase [Thermoleophilaceae bacterium]